MTPNDVMTWPGYLAMRAIAWPVGLVLALLWFLGADALRELGVAWRLFRGTPTDRPSRSLRKLLKKFEEAEKKGTP